MNSEENKKNTIVFYRMAYLGYPKQAAPFHSHFSFGKTIM